MRLLLGCRLFCSQGWRRKQCPGARRQQGRRPPVNGFGAACWRGRMKKQGFAGSKAPTRAPSAGEKPARVGVGGRRNKASRGARRQQRRRQPGKNRPVLALADGEIRLRGEQGANKGAVSPGKTWACWRDRMKKQGFAGSKAPTRAPSAGEKAARVGVGGRRNKASRGARRQHVRPRGVSNAGRFREIGRDDDRSSRSERLSSIFCGAECKLEQEA